MALARSATSGRGSRSGAASAAIDHSVSPGRTTTTMSPSSTGAAAATATAGVGAGVGSAIGSGEPWMARTATSGAEHDQGDEDDRGGREPADRQPVAGPLRSRPGAGGTVGPEAPLHQAGGALGPVRPIRA